MSEFIERNLGNFYNLLWLDQYTTGHNGIIAGGCFRNIFTNEKVKDIDIFFRSSEDFNKAKSYYDDLDEYRSYYENDRVRAYKHTKNNMTIELIKTLYGEPSNILNNFDFTITQFAYYKEIENVDGEEEVGTKILHHKHYFEHLLLKRLVATNTLTFPNSTFERMIKYIKYGYSPCRETKINIIQEIRTNDNPKDSLSESLYFGFD